MEQFIFNIDKKDEEALGSIRCIEGIEIAEDENFLWLKGINSANISNKIKQLPFKNTFVTDENNFLFIEGRLTPVGILKTMNWYRLNEFIKIEAPVSALPGLLNSKISIQLIESTVERKSSAILTTLKVWKQYAESAPASRLLALNFAVSEKNEVLVIGNPLPAIPGKEFWETQNVLIPCRYDFEISELPSFIGEKLNGNKQTIIVFDIDGNFQQIEKSFFVHAKRSAVRLTNIVND